MEGKRGDCESRDPECERNCAAVIGFGLSEFSSYWEWVDLNDERPTHRGDVEWIVTLVSQSIYTLLS